MKTKDQLRKKFLYLRKKKYFDVPYYKFSKLINYIKKKHKAKKKLLSHFTIHLVMKLTS